MTDQMAEDLNLFLYHHSASTILAGMVASIAEPPLWHKHVVEEDFVEDNSAGDWVYLPDSGWTLADNFKHPRAGSPEPYYDPTTGKVTPGLTHHRLPDPTKAMVRAAIALTNELVKQAIKFTKPTQGTT
jgi:hypothetical protein